MRRIGWFLAGATATAVALWKVPAMRERLVGPDPAVDLPPADDRSPSWPGTQFDDVAWAPPAQPAEAATTAMPVAADTEPAEYDADETLEVDLEPVIPPDDAEIDGLRGRIQETRARMRQKARSEAERTRSS